MRITAQCVLLGAFCVINVDGKSSLKKRVSSLEQRMNAMEIRVNIDNDLTSEKTVSLEQDVEALNSSQIRIQDQISNCLNKIKDVNSQTANGKSATIAEFERVNTAALSRGFSDEKKWLREKMVTFENEMKLKENQTDNYIFEIINDLKTLDNKLDVQTAALDVVKKTMINWEKDLDRNLSYLSSDIFVNTNYMLQNVFNEIQETKTFLLQNFSAEMQEKEKLIYEQRLEIDKLKQRLDQQNKSDVLLPTGCSQGWTQFESFCYLYVKVKQTYHAAREKCASLGAVIADTQSRSENLFIVNLCEDGGQEWSGFGGGVWIGFTDEVTETVWMSDRTGIEATYTNWWPGQPNGGTLQQCASIGHNSPRNHGWTWDVLLILVLCVKNPPELVDV